MIANIVATLLRVVVSKKVLVLLLKKIAESTDNKIDDNVVDIVDGSLHVDIQKTSRGVEGLIKVVVPEVIDRIEDKIANRKSAVVAELKPIGE